jgi:DNA (cytosine-5)-methyltransferase 1
MQQKTKTFAKKTRIAVDLFAGGGGLSLGLKQAGFLVAAAVELDGAACETYAANHPSTILFKSDIREISGVELISASPTRKVDLIAACPPCQGFSSLTAKYRRDDPRNELIFEFVRLVREIRPTTLMMENVPGLAMKGVVMFETAMGELKSLGYQLSQQVLDVADYGVPQRRRRLVVLGSLLSPIEVPAPTHSKLTQKGKRPWVTVRDTIGTEEKALTLQRCNSISEPQSFGWHVVRNTSETNLERLRASRPGASRAQLPDELRPKCHQGHDAGFSNVYGRMSWDSPAPTITGGCTTLSKGRFGHPSLLRTISVREAALLQSFPRSYVFTTPYMDKACDIIGNALPPKFAKIMAAACLKTIEVNQDG